MTTLLDLTDTAVPQGKVKVPPRPAQAQRDPVRVNGVEITDEAVRTEAQNHPADTPAGAFFSAARALVVQQLLVQESRALALRRREKSLATASARRRRTPPSACCSNAR